jgi:hypothetical protein
MIVSKKSSMCSYGLQKNGVTLQSWRPEIGVSIMHIFFMISESKKYLRKTTRHIFHPSVDEVNIPLDLLF